MKEIKIRYENGGMIFKLGEDEFCMAEAEAILLFGNSIAHNFRESFDEWNESRDFIARFQVSLEHFFSDVDKTAAFLKLDVAKLRRWIGQGGQAKLETIRQGGLDEFPALKKRLREELFPESEEKDEKPRAGFPTSMKQIRKVAKLVMQKMAPREIAETLKISYSEYIAWISTKAGADEIDKTIRQLSGSGESDTVSHIQDRGIKSTLEETKPL